jgi:hypothetical protein
MFNCIKYEICGQNEKIVLPEISARFLIDVYKLSKAHDVAHLVGDALSKCGVFANLPDTLEENECATIAKIKAKFDEHVFTAVYRYENINYELEQIKQTFNEAQISFIPLKGSVIRKFYPEPWLRTSCDIDILVKEKDADNAAEYLQTQLQYGVDRKGQHDVSMFTASNVHVELHFKLLDSDFKQVKDLLDVWSGDEISLLSDSEYQMSKELFLLYHIYHMAKHFVHGGCGLKPFIDLWIIKNKVGFDEKKAQKIMQESGLLAFFERSTDLVNVWFEDKEHSEITQEMENYILQGGVYGTLKQNLAMSQNKKGGKFRHLMSRIFLSYKDMEVYYPSLKKCPILFPFYQVRRWCRILFCGGRKAAMNEIKVNQNITTEEQERAKKLLEELNL